MTLISSFMLLAFCYKTLVIPDLKIAALGDAVDEAATPRIINIFSSASSVLEFNLTINDVNYEGKPT